MANTMQDVIEGITAVEGKIDGLATKIADLSTDFDAAVAKLQATIDAGQDAGPAVTALTAIAGKLSTASDALSAIDIKAEAISGTPTP